MPSGSFKTSVLTNQICRLKDGCLKFPGTRDTLSLGQLPEEVCLKEVRIKPCGNSFVLDVVLSAPDKGITPMADKDILADLSAVEELKNLRVMAIDPGTDNIAAVVNTFGARPFVIKGGVIKSINQLYNKEMKRLSSCAMTCNKRYRTRRMNSLTEKRNRRIKDQFHKVSRQLADYARDNHVDIVVMGHNTYQKQQIGIGHVNNQNFVQIPMLIFADMLRYKLAEYGIKFVLTEESYTSKADYLAKDYIPVYECEGELHFFRKEDTERTLQTLRWYNNKCRHKWSCKHLEESIPKGKPMGKWHSGHALFCRMHRASYRFMPLCGITETLSDVESVRVDNM